MLIKKELINLWGENNFRAKKMLGQNYLIDSNIKNKIISCINPLKDDIILEIGPGFGELTEDLAAKAKKVIAVEKDRECARILKEEILSGKKNVEITAGDILDYDFKQRFTKIVGNLPYYITTPILEKLILSGQKCDIFAMVQKEYALRMIAKPGTKEYSSLSLFVQYGANIVKLLAVNRACFFPKPAVDSMFLHIMPVSSPKVKVGNSAFLFKIIRASFQQRRKTIRAALTGQRVINMGKNEFGLILAGLGLNMDARPEDLSIFDFARIADNTGGA